MTQEQASVLSLGLNFCPSVSAKKFDLIKDLNLFVKKVGLEGHFSCAEDYRV